MEAARAVLELLPEAECPVVLRTIGPGLLHNQTGARAQMLELGVRIWISGPMAWVEITARYQPGAAAGSPLSYSFPLNPRARLSKFRAQVAGKVVEARVQERTSAVQSYTQSAAAGASLVEQNPGLFRVDLGVVPPGAEVGINMLFVEHLELMDGDYTFRFPLIEAPSGIPQLPSGLGTSARFNLVALLETAGVPLARLACSQDAYTVVNQQRGDYKVELARPHELRPRDFMLRVRLGTDQPRVQLFTGEANFMTCILPPRATQPTPAGVDVFFLVDRSAAMAGPRLEALRRGLMRCLELQGERDRFAIWAYNEQLSGPHAGRLGTQAERPAAAEWLKSQLTATGNADLSRPLEQLRALQPVQGRVTAVVLLSGSTYPNAGELYKGFVARPLAGKVHCLSLTPENAPLLRRLAEMHRGGFTAVASPEQLELSLFRLVSSLRQPVAINMELVDQGLAPVPDSFWPEKVPDLLSGKPVAALGRKTGAGAMALQLALPHAPGTHSFKIAPFPTANPGLPAGWAHVMLTQLEDRWALAAGPEREALRAQITELAVQSSLFSRAAALVVGDLAGLPHVHVVLEPGESLGAPPPPPPTPRAAPVAPVTEPAPESVSAPRGDRGLTTKIQNTGSKLTGDKKITTGAKTQYTKQKPGQDRAALDHSMIDRIREKQKDKPKVYTTEHQTRRLVENDPGKPAGEVDPRFESVWTYGAEVQQVRGGLPQGKLVSVHEQVEFEPAPAEEGPSGDLLAQIFERLASVEERLDRLRRQPSRAHAEPLAEELYYTLGMLEEAANQYPNLQQLFQMGQELYRALLAANPAVIDGLQKWLDQWKKMR